MRSPSPYLVWCVLIVGVAPGARPPESLAQAPCEAAKLLGDGWTTYEERFGNSVSTSGDVALVGAPGDDDRGYNAGAAYVFRKLGGGWVQEAKLTASDGAGGDNFGYAVFLSDDALVVGAPLDDDRGTDSGSAYVFRNDGDTWVQEGKLTSDVGGPYDWFGCSVSISGATALVGAYQDNDLGRDSGSAYVFRWDGTQWVLEAKLLAADGGANDRFGNSVSVSGDTALVGAYGNDDYGGSTGSAYVFRRDGTQWIQEAKLLALDAAGGDFFGDAVFLAGDTALVGAWKDDDRGRDSGSAYVFHWDGTQWVQEAKLLAGDGDGNDRFGSSVSLSGDTALVGAMYDDQDGTERGSAYVFRKVGGEWIQEVKLRAGDARSRDEFGISVSLSGDAALVGAKGADEYGLDSGSAYVFRNVDDVWGQEVEFSADEQTAGDYFGFSVSTGADTTLVGAPWDDDRGEDAGAAYVFQESEGLWTPVVKLTATDGAPSDGFGYSVSLSGEGALVGAPGDIHVGSSPGWAYVFHKIGGVWDEEGKLLADDGALGDRFGWSVCLDGDAALVGAPGDDDYGSYSGSAYVFAWDGTQWVQEAKLVASDGSSSDYFGCSVSLSGDTALVGACRANGNVWYSGATYVFRNVGDVWVQEAKLVAGDGTADDYFGYSVSLSGDAALVGAFGAEGDAWYSGSVYVFRWDGAQWVEEAKLLAADGARGDRFGDSVSLSGDTALVGASSDNNGRGSVYVFRRVDEVWVQDVKMFASDGAQWDSFGVAVSLSGETAVVGAYNDDDYGADAGSAYVFNLAGEDCNENGICDSRDIDERMSEDCQRNGVPDECDVADGTSHDVDSNGIPDECECLGDLDDDGDADESDIGILLADWGCDDPVDGCAGDLNGDDKTDQADLGILLANWGCQD